MTDPLDRPPVDHGSDRHGYVESVNAPEGVFPPDKFVDHFLCPDCLSNLFLKYWPLGTAPPTANVDIHGNAWEVTVAHDDGCPTLAKIETQQ